MSPKTNFVGLDGSRGPSFTHSQANTGARQMMNSGLSVWNQLTGASNPAITRLAWDLRF